ncbi:TIGR02285 family protein [Desulfobulbus elongatus]|uniref:TIGR02285 family protein n=1 Tax=Desulfobulbus elongatus TaxID=53332 RepID=UPI001FE00FE7|nr:TIGR02285 family protein [Desulfobulbus elongatus]
MNAPRATIAVTTGTTIGVADNRRRGAPFTRAGQTPPPSRVRLALPALWLLALVLCPHPLFARDAITWMEVSMPPYLIQEGSAKGQGYGDVVTAILRENLPEYDHYTMVTNVVRHFQKFRDGEKVCSVGLYRTPEREAFMYFSIPSLLTMPAVLIIRKDRHADFGATASVRLDDLLTRQVVIGLSKDRSYGAEIDAVLKRHRGGEQLLYYGGQELAGNYFRMLMRNRVDGLIGLPDEAMYHAERMGLRDQLMTLPLEENRHSYAGWLCTVGCSKNAWGEAVIDRINAILVQQRPTARYRAAYERWLDGATLERYRAVYREVFLTALPPSVPAR